MAAMVNMNSLLNGKDSRWLQLEVCREFQRNKCSRQDTECKFAHPPANVEVQNGKVTACYDSIKGRCNRDKPPCKYFHPPQHLKDQLLINGRNHLALKNALMQQMGIGPGQPVIPGQVPAVASNPYLTSIPANTYSPYFAPGHLVPALLGPDPSAVSQLGPVVPQAVQVAQQKIPRSDRLETAPVSVSAATLTHPMSTPGTTHPHPQPPNAVAAAISHSLEVGKKRAAESDLFQLAFSGMVPYKRPAAEKSGIPVYQPGATTYQQLMQLQQPPFVPVSSTSKVSLNASYVIYTDQNGQLLDTLPVCQDFNRSMCSRLNCRFVHLTEDDKVEVCDQRVAVCRDHANGQCRRKQCKYYHIPVVLPPANIMAAIITNKNNNNSNTKHNQFQTNTQHQQIFDIDQQQQHEQQLLSSITTTTIESAQTTTPAANINKNNLIIIEPQLQQQQQQQYGSQQYHNNNNNNIKSNSNSNSKNIKNNITTLYTHEQQHSPSHQLQAHLLQFNQRHTYNMQSPFAAPSYAPSYASSSASSSGNSSIATSPILSSSTTHSTTSTTTIPTPTPANNYQQHHYMKAAAAPISIPATAAYFDATSSTATPATVVISNDYNANCIPILAAAARDSYGTPTFLYPTTVTATTQQQQQQHQPQQPFLNFQNLQQHTLQPHFFQPISATQHVAIVTTASPTASAT